MREMKKRAESLLQVSFYRDFIKGFWVGVSFTSQGQIAKEPALRFQGYFLCLETGHEHTELHPSDEAHRCPLQSQTAAPAPPATGALWPLPGWGNPSQATYFYQQMEQLWEDEGRNLSFPLGPVHYFRKPEAPTAPNYWGFFGFCHPGNTRRWSG